MSTAEIAHALGKTRREGRGWRCRCPLHGGHSLVISDSPVGRLLVKCWGGGCDPRDILAELRRRGLIAGRDDVAPPIPATTRSDDRADTTRRIALARRIWTAARDARESAVVRYLAGRGITLPVPPSLRWAPRCWHREARAYLPAMIGVVRNVDGELIGVHRTYLTADCRRRDRASLGPVGGGAVRLAPAAETLLVGEGVETCLAAMQATAQPAWAALSTSGMTALLLPPVARTVMILADHDRSGAGERAAQIVAQRWRGEGRAVSVWISPHVGTDVNDLLQAEARRAA